MGDASPMGQLVPLGGGDAIPLLKTRLVIGRREACDIVLDYPNISSQHCSLELQNGYWLVRDLRSRNGVKVNGERVDSKFLLPGDELTIARHKYEIDYQPDPNAPPPADEDPFAMSLLERAGLMRKEEEQRKLRLPPPSRRKPDPSTSAFSEEENDAARWLQDDA